MIKVQEAFDSFDLDHSKAIDRTEALNHWKKGFGKISANEFFKARKCHSKWADLDEDSSEEMKFSSNRRWIGSGRSSEVLISPSSAYLTGETRSNIHATREKSSAFRLIPPFIPFDSKLPHSLVADACRRNGRQNGVTFFFQTQPRAI